MDPPGRTLVSGINSEPKQMNGFKGSSSDRSGMLGQYLSSRRRIQHATITVTVSVSLPMGSATRPGSFKGTCHYGLDLFPCRVLALGECFCSFPCLSRTLPLTEGIAGVCTLVGGSVSSGHLRAFTYLRVGQGMPISLGPVHPYTTWSSLLEPDPWARAEKMRPASY